jgi:hypothetical protein
VQKSYRRHLQLLCASDQRQHRITARKCNEYAPFHRVSRPLRPHLPRPFASKKGARLPLIHIKQ